MTDKFRKTAPIKITFAGSEQPSSEKLTGLAQQTRNALKLLEKAVGDIWNQSGDSLLKDYPLLIPNLARAIGEMKYLNPAIYPLQNDFYFYERIGAKYRGYTTGDLKYVPSSSSYTFYNTSGQFATPVTNEYDVDTTGEYWIDSVAEGKWRTKSELIGGNEEIRYQISPTSDWGDAQLFPSLIPDPRHYLDKFSGCRLTKTGGRYYLYLPPRIKLAFMGDVFEGSEARPTKYPDDVDFTTGNNEALTLSPSDLRFWQSHTINALDHSHYRYSLPKEIANAVLALGTTYPANFLYLWDQVTGTILEGIVFTKPLDAGLGAKPWIIEVASASTSIDLDDYLSSPDDESEAAYSSTNLSLIACGAPLAQKVWELASSFLRHGHDNQGIQPSKVNHKDLTNTNPPKDSVYTHNGRYPSYIPAWGASRYLNDDHVYLLSRSGSQGVGSGDQREPNDNAMLGHLVLANSVADGNGIFLDAACTNNSFRLYFGDIGGSSIYAVGTNLVIASTNNVGIGTTAPAKKLVIAGATSELQAYSDSDISSIDSRALGNTSLKNLLLNVSGGDIGIGIVPISKLHLKYTSTDCILTMDSSTSGTNTYLDFRANTTSKWQLGKGTSDLFFLYDQARTANALQVASGGDMRLMVAGGYVGIGQTAPACKLHISDTVGDCTITIDSKAGNGTYITMRNGTDPRWSLRKETNQNFSIYNVNIGSSPVLIWPNSDIQLAGTGTYVGIGPTYPTSLLHLSNPSGDSYITIDSKTSVVPNASSGIVFREGTAAKFHLAKSSYNTIQIYDYVRAAQVFEVFSNGHMDLMPSGGIVSIGETSPASETTLTVRNRRTSGDYQKVVQILSPSITNGHHHMLQIGKADSANNCGEIQWLHNGDGLTTNELILGVQGKGPLHLSYDRAKLDYSLIFTPIIMPAPGITTAGMTFVHSTGNRQSVYNGQEWSGTVGKVLASTSSADSRTTTGWFNQSYGIPANSLRMDSVIRVRATGHVDSHGGGGTIAINTYLYDVTNPTLKNLITTVVKAPVTSDVFKIDIYIIVSLPGSSGNVYISGDTIFGAPNAGTAQPTLSSITWSIDTTHVHAIILELFESAGGNDVHLDSLVVDISD